MFYKIQIQKGQAASDYLLLLAGLVVVFTALANATGQHITGHTYGVFDAQTKLINAITVGGEKIVAQGPRKPQYMDMQYDTVIEGSSNVEALTLNAVTTDNTSTTTKKGKTAFEKH